MGLYGLLAECVFVGGRRFIDRKYTEGLEQRHGFFSSSVPQGGVWIHAVSVGEVQSALGLVQQVRRQAPDLPVLITTVTQTGAAMARQLMGPDIHAYYPWDAPSIVRRALDILKPRCFVTMETEMWPAMLTELSRRNIPAFMVNGRLSSRSFAGYRRWKFFWKPLLKCYEVILARTELDGQRFLQLGAAPERVMVIGENKVDALLARREITKPPVFDQPERPVLLAGSIHGGEDEVVFDCWQHVRAKHPEARLIIVPRHPERAKNLADLFAQTGKLCLASDLRDRWDVMVVDIIGQLFGLYGLARAAFVGGSLVPRGGQNVYEPALWGCPFCVGPNFEDFAEPVMALTELGLCRVINDSSTMAQFFCENMDNQDREERLQRSENFFAGLSGSASCAWDVIDRRMTALQGYWR